MLSLVPLILPFGDTRTYCTNESTRYSRCHITFADFLSHVTAGESTCQAGRDVQIVPMLVFVPMAM